MEVSNSCNGTSWSISSGSNRKISKNVPRIIALLELFVMLCNLGINSAT